MKGAILFEFSFPKTSFSSQNISFNALNLYSFVVEKIPDFWWEFQEYYLNEPILVPQMMELGQNEFSLTTSSTLWTCEAVTSQNRSSSRFHRRHRNEIRPNGPARKENDRQLPRRVQTPPKPNLTSRKPRLVRDPALAVYNLIRLFHTCCVKMQ